MSSPAAEPVPWLPSDALSRERLKAVLDDILAAWSSHWLAGSTAKIAAGWQDDWPSPAGGGCRRSCEGLAWLTMTPAGEAFVAGAMLSAQVPQTMHEREREVVTSLAASAADDLLNRVGLLVRGEPGRVSADPSAMPDAGSSLWDISIGNRRNVVRFALSMRAMVAMTKRSLRAPPRIELGSLAEGMAGAQIELSAGIGHCALSLTEVQGLAPGDVLVLDQPASAPVEILVDGIRSRLGARLEIENERPTLTLVPTGKTNG